MFPEGFRHHAHKLNVGFEGSPEVSWFEGVDVRNNNKALGNAASTKKEKKGSTLTHAHAIPYSATPIRHWGQLSTSS